MTAPTRAEAEALVQQAVLGDLPEHAPALRAAITAFPDLAAELRELLAVRDRLAALTADADSVAAEARGAVRPDDVARLHELHRRSSATRRWPLWLAALLLAGLAIVAWQGSRQRQAPVDGTLEVVPDSSIDRSGPTWTVDPGMQLPPGSQYLVTLEIDGRAAAPPRSFSRPVQLPAEWQPMVDRAATAHLLVELPELGWRRRVTLR